MHAIIHAYATILTSARTDLPIYIYTFILYGVPFLPLGLTLSQPPPPPQHTHTLFNPFNPLPLLKASMRMRSAAAEKAEAEKILQVRRFCSTPSSRIFLRACDHTHPSVPVNPTSLRYTDYATL